MGDRLRAGIPSRYVTSQLGQLSLASLRGRLSSTSFGWGKGGNVTSAGWRVTLCDPVRHVSSRSGVATLRTAIHLLLTQLLCILRSWSVRVRATDEVFRESTLLFGRRVTCARHSDGQYVFPSETWSCYDLRYPHLSMGVNAAGTLRGVAGRAPKTRESRRRRRRGGSGDGLRPFPEN